MCVCELGINVGSIQTCEMWSLTPFQYVAVPGAMCSWICSETSRSLRLEQPCFASQGAFAAYVLGRLGTAPLPGEGVGAEGRCGNTPLRPLPAGGLVLVEQRSAYLGVCNLFAVSEHFGCAQELWKEGRHKQNAAGSCAGALSIGLDTASNGCLPCLLVFARWKAKICLSDR